MILILYNHNGIVTLCSKCLIERRLTLQANARWLMLTHYDFNDSYQLGWLIVTHNDSQGNDMNDVIQSVKKWFIRVIT